LKKGKTSSKQSKKTKPKAEKSSLDVDRLERLKGIKVLVPLLSKREAHPIFIEKIASRAREVILLLVIDTNAMVGQFGFATNEIAGGNHLMQQVKEALGKKRKTCNDVIEWGDTITKIEHLAELYHVDKIYMVRQDNQFFRKLLQDMRETLKEIEIEIVKLPEV